MLGAPGVSNAGTGIVDRTCAGGKTRLASAESASVHRRPRATPGHSDPERLCPPTERERVPLTTPGGVAEAARSRATGSVVPPFAYPVDEDLAALVDGRRHPTGERERVGHDPRARPQLATELGDQPTIRVLA